MAGRRPGHLRARCPARETVADGGFVLPGLVDAHCHIGIAPRRRPDQPRSTRPGSWPASTGTPGCWPSGTPGSPYPYPELDDDPDMPRLARAGRHVAPPQALPARHRRRGRRGRGGRDGGRAGRAPATAGSSWSATGSTGASATSPRPGTPTRMTAAVAAAHAAGVRAAVHTFSEESAVEIMVRAGVDSVEHGTGLSLDLIDEMARRGTALVPTMINIADVRRHRRAGPGEVPRVRRPHARPARPASPRWCAPRTRPGVPIYVGTDAGGGIDHGLAAEEMLLLHEQAGMSADGRARRRLLAGPGVARLPRPGRGRPGRPGGLRRGPAPRPARGPDAQPDRPARPRRPLTGRDRADGGRARGRVASTHEQEQAHRQVGQAGRRSASTGPPGSTMWLTTSRTTLSAANASGRRIGVRQALAGPLQQRRRRPR